MMHKQGHGGGVMWTVDMLGLRCKSVILMNV